MTNRFEKITSKQFIEVFNKAVSKENIRKLLDLPNNGTSSRFINNMIETLGLNTQIIKENRFNKHHFKKVCPVCGKEFYIGNGDKEKKKVCCSYSCANTYFRSGDNNGMYKGCKLLGKKSYTTICFRHHQHKCCVCGEEKIVAVHHYDGDHNNNDICNLVPLCPTHHQYIHSRYKDEIQQIVDEYRKNFINENKLFMDQ